MWNVNWIQINVDKRVALAGETPDVTLEFTARLYRYAVLLSLPILFLLLFPTPFLPLGLGGVLILFVLRWRALSSPFPHTRVNIPLLLLYFTILFGMLHAPDLGTTVLTVARLLAGLLTFYLVIDYADHPGRAWNIATALVCLGVLIVLLAPAVTEPSTEKLLDVSFLFDSRLPHLWDVSNPNAVAGTLAALTPLALALLLSEVRVLRALGGFALLPLLGMMVLLQARGALLAVLAGIVLFATLYKRWFLVLAPLAALGLVYLGTQIPNPATNILARNSMTGLLSIEGRAIVWDFAARELVSKPLGIGVHAYSIYADNLWSDVLSLPQRQHPHNLFLQAGLDTGFLGLGAFCIVLAYALYASWHSYRNGVKRELAMGVFAALIVITIHGIFEPNMWGNKAVVVLWSILGIAVALGRFGARRGRRRGMHTPEPSN